MLLRFPTLAIPSLLFAAACAATPPTSTDDPGDPGDPGNPVDPGSGRPLTSTEQAATGLGMSIMSSDAFGTPRLIRAIVPRPAAAGMTAEVAARDHIAALAPLWIQEAKPMALAQTGVQPLRNGATFVRLQQHVDGVVVEQGELRILINPDGSLAAVSGSLLPSPTKPVFVSSARQALEHALDKQYGAARPQFAITEGAVNGGWQSLDVASTPELTVSS